MNIDAVPFFKIINIEYIVKKHQELKIVSASTLSNSFVENSTANCAKWSLAPKDFIERQCGFLVS